MSWVLFAQILMLMLFATMCGKVLILSTYEDDEDKG